MSAISITGARIARLDNVRPAHRQHLRRIEALKLEESLRYRCLEVSITFISGPHDVLDQILAPYSHGSALRLFRNLTSQLLSALLTLEFLDAGCNRRPAEPVARHRIEVITTGWSPIVLIRL